MSNFEIDFNANAIFVTVVQTSGAPYSNECLTLREVRLHLDRGDPDFDSVFTLLLAISQRNAEAREKAREERELAELRRLQEKYRHKLNTMGI
jgi:hypothetical protein